MRYYFINSDNEDVVIDVTQDKNTFVIDEKSYSYRTLAGKYYISSDNVTWKKIVKLPHVNSIVDKSQNYKVYRGYKPSGLFNANAGDLVTDMPGKIVKLMTNIGDEVKKGDTLLILEAMKMENEIKAGMDGTVKSINVEAGQAIESGFLMMELE